LRKINNVMFDKLFTVCIQCSYKSFSWHIYNYIYGYIVCFTRILEKNQKPTYIYI
jgi:hypothetical protein